MTPKRKGDTSEEKPQTRGTTLKAAARKLFTEAGNSSEKKKMSLGVKIVAVSGEVTPGCGRSV